MKRLIEIKHIFYFLLIISFLSIYSEETKTVKNTEEAKQENKPKSQKEIRNEKKFLLAIGYGYGSSSERTKPWGSKLFTYNLQFQYNINSSLSFSAKFVYSKTSEGSIDLGHISPLDGINMIEGKETSSNAIFNPTLKYFIFKSIYIGVGGGRNFGPRNYRGIRYSSEGEGKGNFFNLRPYETYHLEYEPYNFYSASIGFENYKEDGGIVGFEFQASSIINEKSKRKAYYTYEPGVILLNDKINLDKLLFLNTFTKYDPETKKFNHPVPTFYIWIGGSF